jgi:simple sugar transport system permease protein
MDLYEAFMNISVAAVSSAVALLLPALGEGVSERAGVLNIGTEGYMIIGALAAYYGYLGLESIWIGFLMAGVAGLILSWVHAFFTITLKRNQIVSGTGLWLFGMGFTAYLFRLVGITAVVEKLKVLAIPGFQEIPYFGSVFFRQNVVGYASFLLVPIFAIALHRTPWGLVNKAAGDSPLAADMAGHNVSMIRYLSIGICGIMAGLGGGYLAIGSLNRFSEGLTAGRGFIAIAIVIFGGWDPKRILGGALFFSFIDSLQLYLQAQGSVIPYPLLIIMPYVLTLMVLAATSKRAKNIPHKLGVPYIRGEE